MISVIVTILKIIGIVLLAVLGILLLLICLILFVPIRYSVKGKIEDRLTAKGDFRFLLSFLHYGFTFEDGEFDGQLKICGIRKKKTVDSAEEPDDRTTDESDNTEPDMSEDKAEQLNDPDEIPKDPDEISRKLGRKTDQVEKDSDDKKKTTSSGKKNPLGTISRKWKRLCGKAREILHSTERIRKFLTDEKTKYVSERVVSEGLYLLRHLGFRKLKTELTFSLADPARTGQALGILSMIPALYKYEFHIYPDFESEQFYLRGSFEARGRIRLIYVLVVAVRLLKEKTIRESLKKILKR